MIDLIFIFGAKYLFVLSCIIAGWYFLTQSRPQQKKLVIFGLLSFILAYLLATLANHIYYDPRPFVVDGIAPLIPHAPDNGFPSDHTLLVSAIAAVFCFFNKKISAWLWIIALCVGISRVYVGVHHITDIVGSIAISIVSTYIVYWLFKKVPACAGRHPQKDIRKLEDTL
ncbi:MAG: undecaprenyl-diphosphatase [Candidatus Pacebacteria bacterium]|nr:undecaprenyl-diphosphatase [Candidatus Paceibacterota bacterium]